MKKIALILVFITSFSFGQITQIGSTIDGLSEDDNFFVVASNADGNIVALSGNAYDTGTLSNVGNVRVFSFDGSSWNQLGNDIIGVQENSYLGGSISFSDDGFTLAIGVQLYSSETTDDIGQVQVFNFDGDDWIQIGQNINGSNFQDQLGRSVSLSGDGNIIAVGIPGFNTALGKVKVYMFDGIEWIQIGSDIMGDNILDFFGIHVNIDSDGDRLAVTASQQSGTAYTRIFEYATETDWLVLGNDITSTDTSWLQFTGDLSGNGDIVVIGNGGFNSSTGRATVFQYNDTTWEQMGQHLDGSSPNDLFGFSTSLDDTGTILSIGTPLYDGNGTDSGRTFLYKYNGTIWGSLGFIDGDKADDQNGLRVALSRDGSRVVIGSASPDLLGNAKIFEFSDVLNIQENTIDNPLHFYPNPTEDVLFIKSTKEINNISVFNILGQQIDIISQIHDSETQLDLSRYQESVFLLKIETELGVQTIKAFSK